MSVETRQLLVWRTDHGVSFFEAPFHSEEAHIVRWGSYSIIAAMVAEGMLKQLKVGVLPVSGPFEEIIYADRAAEQTRQSLL